MTKEELEKEVEEYLENKHCKNVCIRDEIEECKQGIRIRCTAFDYRKKLIVNFVEPREKRIEELIALINAERERQEKCDDVHLRKIADLEKENAELKKDKKELCHSISEGGKACVYLNEQLTKAKELLKKLLSAYTSYADSFDDRDNEIVAEAEQFLKEE